MTPTFPPSRNSDTYPNAKGTHTEEPSTISSSCLGLTPIDDSLHPSLFEYENHPPPDYRLNLSSFSGEELAEATLKDKHLQAIIKLVKEQNWDQLKLLYKYYNLSNNLGVAHQYAYFMAANS